MGPAMMSGMRLTHATQPALWYGAEMSLFRLAGWLFTFAALGVAQEYRHPIVFCRTHYDGAGHAVLKSKICIMEEDGSKQKQLTRGPSYDDHPSLYSDLRHVLYAEFAADDYNVDAGARLVRLDIYTGQRETVP